jgi:hypothetical protein
MTEKSNILSVLPERRARLETANTKDVKTTPEPRVRKA